jgi:hypothetical protein
MNTAEAVINAEERRMDCELTVAEIDRLYLLAIRDRAKTQDQDPAAVNLARKLAEYRRRAGKSL